MVFYGMVLYCMVSNEIESGTMKPWNWTFIHWWCPDYTLFFFNILSNLFQYFERSVTLVRHLFKYEQPSSCDCRLSTLAIATSSAHAPSGRTRSLNLNLRQRESDCIFSIRHQQYFAWHALFASFSQIREEQA